VILIIKQLAFIPLLYQLPHQQNVDKQHQQHLTKPKANIKTNAYYKHQYVPSISNLDLGTKTRPNENLMQFFYHLYSAHDPDSAFTIQVSSHPLFSLSLWSQHSSQTFNIFFF